MSPDDIETLDNSLQRLGSSHINPQDLRAHLQNVSSFIGAKMEETPSTDSFPSLTVIVFTIRAGISPALLLDGTAIPQLVDLITGVEEYRRVFMQEIDEALEYDDLFRSTNQLENTYSKKDRQLLESRREGGPAAKRAYAYLISKLCVAHICHLLSSEDVDIIALMAYMNDYFPWIASEAKSPRLHLKPDLFMEGEDNGLLLTAANDCQNALRTILEWAKERMKTESLESMQDALRGGEKPDLLVPDTETHNAQLTGLLFTYISDTLELQEETNRLSPSEV